MKKVARTLALLLTLCTLFSCLSVFASATPATNNNPNAVYATKEAEKEAIIEEYRTAMRQQASGISTVGTRSSDNNLSAEQIQQNAVAQLNEIGYDAYGINPQTFESSEIALKTDLEAAGLSPDGTYIIVLEGEENNTSVANTRTIEYGPSVPHTYNGVEYVMRYMSVYPLSKFSQVNVLESKVEAVIIHCLDATISIAVGAVSDVLGIVHTILGLSISDFKSDTEAYLDLNACSDWRRRYTQVYCEFSNEWVNGSCTEYVSAKAYLNGWYYNASTGTHTAIYETTLDKLYPSSHYLDLQWQRDSAARGYINSYIVWDLTDPVEYKYNGIVKITHRDNFA